MTIGLFAPLPLAMMIPFMAGQSLMMGEAFGKGFQYGKRKISSMSNEEFNALTADDLGKSIQTDYNQIIPHLGQAVKASSEFQSLVIREIIDQIKNAPGDILNALRTSSDPDTQTETSASVYGAGGTVTDIRLGGGVRPSTGLSTSAADVKNDVNNIITFTQDVIDDLARKYMEATGLADFQRARDKIGEMIRAKNIPREDFTRGFAKPTGPVNIRAVGTTGRNVQAIREASAATKIRIMETIKNLGPLIQNKKQELINLQRFSPTRVIVRGASGVARSRAQAIQDAKYGKRRANYARALKILQNQLLDLLKKLSNARIQLSNFR